MMRASLRFPFALLAALAGGCNSGNPVAPPAPAVPPPSSQLKVTVTSSQGSVVAGSTQGATLTITARPAAGGAPPADGTPVNVNTNLGNFGVDAAGKPLQMITRQLAGGSAAATFYPGSQTGTANILAQVGTSTGSLNLPVLATPPPLVADFTFETAGLAVLFTDVSTGLPTTFAWDFGDGAASAIENPSHTYAAAGSYAVTFTAATATATATRRKFVTVQPQPGVTADFGFQTSGLTALFTYLSSGNPTSWSWSFGDCGNPPPGGCQSGVRNASHTYLQPGSYAVTLTASDAATSSSISKFVTVARQGGPPQADFAFQVTGLTVLFADQSTGTPTKWSWTFGDGSPRDLDQNPSHSYTAAGSYTVSLTASNDAGQSTKTKFVTVASPPQADFAFQANGLTVAFSDRSSGNPASWSWNFGDCPQNPSCTNTKDANPTHVYSTGGTYTVSLTVANSGGQATATKFVTVSGGTPPRALFSTQTSGLTVIFTDRSSGNPTGWAWNFGDCPRNPSCSSADQNPTHTYSAAGTYTVTLTASNSAGSNSVSLLVGVSSP
jgi:PKD repeat protein